MSDFDKVSLCVRFYWSRKASPPPSFVNTIVKSLFFTIGVQPAFKTVVPLQFSISLNANCDYILCQGHSADYCEYYSQYANDRFPGSNGSQKWFSDSPRHSQFALYSNMYSMWNTQFLTASHTRHYIISPFRTLRSLWQWQIWIRE